MIAETVDEIQSSTLWLAKLLGNWLEEGVVLYIMRILNLVVFGAPVYAWLLTLATTIILYLACQHLAFVWVQHQEAKEKAAEEDADNTAPGGRFRLTGVKPFAFLAILLRSTIFLTPILIAVTVGISWLQSFPSKPVWVGRLPLLLFLVQVGLWGRFAIRWAVRRWVMAERLESQRQTLQTLASPLVWGINFILWVALLVFALDVMRINVTSLVAGLGIGGVAIALASQTILGDIFSAIIIVLDKPFIVGDFIIVEGFMGTIEHIGLKTTRIRSLDGELILFPNSALLSKTVRNYRPITHRRVTFKFMVRPETPASKLQIVSPAIQDILKDYPLVRPDFAHLVSLDRDGYVFEVAFNIDSGDIGVARQHQEQVMLKLIERLTQEGIVLNQVDYHTIGTQSLERLATVEPPPTTQAG